MLENEVTKLDELKLQIRHYFSASTAAIGEWRSLLV